jgi:hypothetical protein
MECTLVGKPKFSEKTYPSATFVHHKIPHDQTRVLNPGRRGGNPATIFFLYYYLVCEAIGTAATPVQVANLG